MTSAFLVCLGAFIFFVRVFLRKVSRVEWLLMGFFILHTALIVFQQYVDVKVLIYDPRYHKPAYPVLFGWVAYPLSLLIQRFKWTIPALVLVFIILICRVPRERCVQRKNREAIMEISRQAAEVIRRDWNGPSRVSLLPCLEEYRSSRAPAIAAPPTITYPAGGRQVVGDDNKWWRNSVEEWPEQPDYICFMNEHRQHPDFSRVISVCESGAYELIEEFRHGFFVLWVYRRRSDVK